ncbi:MAG: GrpB family protein [Spirochaetes bacterium]|nr:GrpB family protein [Spirochaetota bacterium]
MEIRGRAQGIASIEHIESTSVYDLCSKPIIDILIGFLSKHEFEKNIP